MCTGAGGQALGLEAAGFRHEALVEIDSWACKTLRLNRPEWNVWECDIATFPAHKYKDIELYWHPKLSRNVERDKLSIASLKKEGWRVLVIWECETKNIEKLERRLRQFLD
ncbi:MAG TPA: DNA cytosine methyltransferase [Rhizomicrobium sp.]|nr:DNA cytosine methyltransferase [Rhizomicrobium sp.]